jgi:hypothetical protein
MLDKKISGYIHKSEKDIHFEKKKHKKRNP